MSGRVLLVEHNELVRNNAHFLQCNSLGLCPWETFNDPAFLASFHLFNLLLHKFDHNFISDIAVRGKRLLDILSELLIFLGDLTSDQVTH